MDHQQFVERILERIHGSRWPIPEVRTVHLHLARREVRIEPRRLVWKGIADRRAEAEVEVAARRAKLPRVAAVEEELALWCGRDVRPAGADVDVGAAALDEERQVQPVTRRGEPVIIGYEVEGEPPIPSQVSDAGLIAWSGARSRLHDSSELQLFGVLHRN